MSKVDARLMEEKLKLGWTTMDFSKKLGISEENFLELLSKNFDGRVYETYTRRLKDNDRRREKNMARERSNSEKRKNFRRRMATQIAQGKNMEGISEKEKTSDTNNEPEETDLTKKEEEANQEEKLKENQETNPPESNDAEVIVKLEAQAEDVKQEIITLEKNHKELITEKHEIEETCRELLEEMLKLREKLQKKSEEVELAVLKLKETAQNLEKTNADLKAGKDLLEEIQAEIQSLQKYIVNVTNEGIEITPELKVDIEETWKSIRSNWMDDEKFFDVTMAELNALAKVTAIKQELERQQLKFEIIFASDRLKSLFEA